MPVVGGGHHGRAKRSSCGVAQRTQGVGDAQSRQQNCLAQDAFLQRVRLGDRRNAACSADKRKEARPGDGRGQLYGVGPTLRSKLHPDVFFQTNN